MMGGGDSGTVVAEKCSTGTGSVAHSSCEGGMGCISTACTARHHRITGSPYLPRNKIQDTVRIVASTPLPHQRPTTDPLELAYRPPRPNSPFGDETRLRIDTVARARQPGRIRYSRARAFQPSRSALASPFGTETARGPARRPDSSCWVWSGLVSPQYSTTSHSHSLSCRDLLTRRGKRAPRACRAAAPRGEDDALSFLGVGMLCSGVVWCCGWWYVALCVCCACCAVLCCAET